MQIEEMLGIAIHVERPELGEVLLTILHPLLSISVGRSRGGIDEPPPALQRPFRQALRIAVVVLHQVGGVPLGRRGAGAQVENVAYVLQRIELTEQLGRVQIIIITQRDKILPFFVAAEHVG